MRQTNHIKQIRHQSNMKKELEKKLRSKGMAQEKNWNAFLWLFGRLDEFADMSKCRSKNRLLLK